MQVITDLRGLTHARFFTEAMAQRMRAPAHVSVDGAPAWNGVREQVGVIHGNPDEISLIMIEGEVSP